jgi:hypothetical protein
MMSSAETAFRSRLGDEAIAHRDQSPESYAIVSTYTASERKCVELPDRSAFELKVMIPYKAREVASSETGRPETGSNLDNLR